VRKGLPYPSLSHHPFCFNLAHLLDIFLLPRASQVDENILEPKVTGVRITSSRPFLLRLEAIEVFDHAIELPSML
jgi:hypothetical protein